MKRIIIALLVGAFMLSLSACKIGVEKKTESVYVQPEPKLDEEVYTLPENVEAWVVEGSTDSTHAVLNVVNTSSTAISFPLKYRLEKQIDGNGGRRGIGGDGLHGMLHVQWKERVRLHGWQVMRLRQCL